MDEKSSGSRKKNRTDIWRGLGIKAGAEPFLNLLLQIFNEILLEGNLHVKQMLSSMVAVYNGKVDPLAQTWKLNKKIKLLNHAFNIYESALDKKLLRIVDINKKQYGFIPCKRTVDAVFISRRFA